jgi:predicted TPR repeat methyltransferase
MNDPRKKIVEDGYNAIAERHLDWIGQIEGDPRERFLFEFSQLLPAGTLVLELGCGAGEPSTRLLAERFNVIGVDISAAQLRLSTPSRIYRATSTVHSFIELPGGLKPAAISLQQVLKSCGTRSSKCLSRKVESPSSGCLRISVSRFKSEDAARGERRNRSAKRNFDVRARRDSNSQPSDP